jgi:hypothetical protein
MFIESIIIDDAVIDCATACWFKHNILNPSYDLGFLYGQGGQDGKSDPDSGTGTATGTATGTVTRR